LSKVKVISFKLKFLNIHFKLKIYFVLKRKVKLNSFCGVKELIFKKKISKLFQEKKKDDLVIL
jgi:hypothetical protein